MEKQFLHVALIREICVFLHLPAFLGYSCCSLPFVTPSFSVSSSRYCDPVIFLPASSESISFWSTLFKPYCYSVTLSFKSSFVQPSSTSSWMFRDSTPPPTSIIYTPGSCPISCLCFAMLPNRQNTYTNYPCAPVMFSTFKWFWDVSLSI